jgi:hypothetical protein
MVFIIGLLRASFPVYTGTSLIILPRSEQRNRAARSEHEELEKWKFENGNANVKIKLKAQENAAAPANAKKELPPSKWPWRKVKAIFCWAIRR